MIVSSKLQQLLDGEVEELFLFSGYRLKINDYKQIFISRGKKKRYFLSKEFVCRYLVESQPRKDEKNYTYLQDVKEILSELMKKKLGLETRSSLESIDAIINMLL